MPLAGYRGRAPVMTPHGALSVRYMGLCPVGAGAGTCPHRTPSGCPLISTRPPANRLGVSCCPGGWRHLLRQDGGIDRWSCPTPHPVAPRNRPGSLRGYVPSGHYSSLIMSPALEPACGRASLRGARIKRYSAALRGGSMRQRRRLPGAVLRHVAPTHSPGG